MIKPTRAGKAGALIGGTVGVVKGTVDGVRKVKMETADGTFQLNRHTALLVGGRAAINGAVGAVVGFGVGEVGDRLLARDGARGMAKKVNEAKAFADGRGIEGEARETLIARAKQSVQAARSERLASDGNRLLFGRPEALGMFKKNPVRLTPDMETLHAAMGARTDLISDEVALPRPKPDAARRLERQRELRRKNALVKKLIERGDAPDATPFDRLLSREVAGQPALQDQTNGWVYGGNYIQSPGYKPTTWEQLSRRGTRLSGSQDAATAALGDFMYNNNRRLGQVLDSVPQDVQNTIAEGATSILEFYQKVLETASR